MNWFEQLVSRGWIQRLNSEFSKDEILRLRERYLTPGITRDFKTATHRTICVRAHALAESVFVLNGSKAEIHKALEYLLICLDCEKYSLDYKRYRDEHGIRDLEKKYGMR